MEQKDREQLDFCCENVVPKINMMKLWPKLLEYKIYNRDDVNIPRWTRNLNALSTVEDVYLTIKTRGPHAFKNLLLSLRHSDHDYVADILEGTANKQKNYPFQHNIQESNEPLQIKLRKATKFFDTPDYDNNILRYPMRSKPRGLVLIITNIHYNSDEKPRFSAIHDEVNLKQLFEEMGFEVVTYQNLTGQKIKEVVQAFSHRDDLKKVDSCFVIITSHGTEDKQNHDTEIQGVDYENLGEQINYEKVLCTDIKDYFTAEACPHLAEKPKIFIFQLCRGNKKQTAVTHPRLITDTRVIPTEVKEQLNFELANNKQSIRNYADMLVAHSTLPGYVAYRDSITGSWFITILCKVFMEHACSNHVQDLFNLVDAELNKLRATNNECQTLSVKSIGFNKHCYLNPGLFEGV